MSPRNCDHCGEVYVPANGPCPYCGGDEPGEYEPTETAQGLIPIPDGYREQ